MNQKRKGKAKTKKKTGRRVPAKKKVSRKKATKRVAKQKALKSVTGAVALTEATGIAADPVGCCYWVDAAGQNRFEQMTQSVCKGKPNSTFRANKKCPGGGG
jgi:hypothetical protein